MLDLRDERMSDAMLKIHVGDPVQVSGTYQWRDGGPWRKTWHRDAQWERVSL